MKPSIKSVSLDQLGITASVACAIHCAALPFIITTLPLWGLEFLAHSWVELSMICLSLVIGICSLSTSFPKHEKVLPIMVLVTGFGFIAIGHYAFHSLEAVLIPISGFTIAAAHYLNWKYSRSCNHHKTK
ncbi:MerC domain-containing protein [Pedobacter sp. ASV1-7]|uniref:MerC domain-containing protein n=1 Tax=Pedobacter sp. ASV1-7 TaxID=3145237 RepID=UPI0032E8CEDF